jgi:hypothetical protein
MADDPPRTDFATSTRVRARFATPQYIEPEDPSERAALEAARAADWAEAYLAAHLRAFERLQGARRAGRNPEAQQRAEEAAEHARASGRALQSLADRLADLERHSSARGRFGERTGRPHLTDVSEEAQAIMFLGGLRIRDLDNVLQGTRLEDARVSTERFRDASATFAQFASVMAQWTPPSAPELAMRSAS